MVVVVVYCECGGQWLYGCVCVVEEQIGCFCGECVVCVGDDIGVVVVCEFYIEFVECVEYYVCVVGVEQVGDCCFVFGECCEQ